MDISESIILYLQTIRFCKMIIINKKIRLRISLSMLFYIYHN